MTDERRPPNILVLVTDQQRYPRHWPDEPGWLRELMPNDAELARTGLSFDNAYCNTAMCSPSRATLFTGLYPAQHGVTLTLTQGDLRPDPAHRAAVLQTVAEIMRQPAAPRRRLARQFLRGLLGIGLNGGGEQQLRPEIPNLPRMLRAAGYEVAYKGKWHLTHPQGNADGTSDLLGGWGDLDTASLERDYGFADWDAPDAGENAQAAHFGGGTAGPGEGWDEEYTRQTERWLGRADLPEPFCLVVSLVNPHDVLGYPASYIDGGYWPADFRGLGVDLPPSVDEDLSSKPAVHTLMQVGMTAYIGPLRNRREQLDYVNFYAHLHRVIDEKIGRVLGALGDPDDPDSLRSRTVVVRCADHGEMGLSHGGLRQKTFNVYDETVNVPLVISNPVLFPQPAQTSALASLIDVVPTLATLTGASAPHAQGRDLTPIIADRAAPDRERIGRTAVDLSPVAGHPDPAPSVHELVHFTYDDHQAGTAAPEAPGQPNRVRSVFDHELKYAVYLDPAGKAAPEYELYDRANDPDEVDNLLDVHTGEPSTATARRLRDEGAERLDAVMLEHGTAVGPT
jgi:arylsulfatase A-like enzyme